MPLYFEDFRVGDTYRSAGRTITETDIVLFAGLSGDFVELHTNEEYARQSVFGRRIAHGALVFSISVGLATQMGHFTGTILAFYGLDRLRFTKPVFIGDTIRVEKQVAAVEPRRAASGLVTFETQVVNQAGQTVLVYRDKLLLTRRAP